MKRKKILILSWLLITLIFVLSLMTPLSINNQLVVYLFLLIGINGFPFIRWVTSPSEANVGKGRLFKILLVISLAFVTFYEVFLNWGGNWQTQAIDYQHRYLSNRTIEFQMKDVGGMGYNRRTVDRTKLVPFVDWIIPIQERIRPQEDSLIWKKVDIYVNELGMKDI